MQAPPLHLHGRILPSGESKDVYVSARRITFVPVAGARSVIADGYLLPGLVDAHAHLELASPAPGGSSLADTMAASARAHLDQGVLLVREPGGPTRDAREIGPQDGLPRVISGGRFLAAPGSYFPGLAREVSGDRLAAAAVEEYQASGHWAKIVGDFFDADGVVVPTFDAPTMAAAVEAVHAAGGRVAVHAMTAATIERAIEAGVDSLEHATELAPEHLPGIARRGIAVVPTMLIAEPIVETVAGWGSPARELRRWQGAVARQPEMVGRAAAEGILILAGTDAGMVPHGRVLEEVERLRAAGLDGEVALGAASWIARSWLGLAGLEEGAPADIVAYADDPRGRLRARRPLVRILDGQVLED